MLPREKYIADQKEQDKQRELATANFEAMLVAQMETKLGRDYVRHVLKKLNYNETCTQNSAEAYRFLAKQEIAITLYKELYKYVPGKVELMMREAQTNGMCAQ